MLEPLDGIENYAVLNGRVHRTAADPLGHPAVTRHLAFWDRHKRSEDERAIAIQHYFKKLTERLEAAECTEIHSPRIELVEPHVRGRYFSFHFRWCGIYTTMRFEVTTEYVTCTTTLDFSFALRSSPSAHTPQSGTRAWFGNAFSHIIAVLTSQLRHVLAPNQQKYDAIYKDCWNFFEIDILDYNSECTKTFGKYFADFRGFITGDVYPLPASASAANPPVEAPFHFNAVPPFSFAPNIRARPHFTGKPSKVWQHNVSLRILQFLLVEAAGSELTISGLLDGRVMYISALGPQSSDTPRPVFYYMHSSTDDEWQLGRLVDRMHTLGTLRLAATMKVNALYKVGFKLSGIETSVQRCQTAVRELIVDTRKKDELEARLRQGENNVLELELATLKENIRQKQIALNGHLEGLQEKIGSMETEFIDSIDDRIKQACYYIDRFKNDVEALRVRRLEGFQPYREFVFRRLGSTFSFIESLSKRVEVYRADRVLLNDSIINLGIRHVISENAEILKVNASISTDLDHQNVVMKGIQDVGEIVLFCVIAPHYLNETLLKFSWGSEPCGPLYYWCLSLAVLVGSIFAFIRVLAGTWGALAERKAGIITGQIVKLLLVLSIMVVAWEAHSSWSTASAERNHPDGFLCRSTSESPKVPPATPPRPTQR